jgi:lipoate-protein ligase A
VERAEGTVNMARDCALLEAAEAGTAGWRVYDWDGPWVTLGRFQKPEKALVQGWTKWSQRPTGGRAVLHGHDVTFAIAVPHGGDSRRLKDLYRRLCAPLVQALNGCGLRCLLAEDTPFAEKGPAGEDCFAFRSANDIVCHETGHKVCGCALRIGSRAALLQASIPYRSPLIAPDDAIVGAVEVDFLRWDHERFEDAIAAATASR